MLGYLGMYICANKINIMIIEIGNLSIGKPRTTISAVVSKCQSIDVDLR